MLSMFSCETLTAVFSLGNEAAPQVSQRKKAE